MIDSFLSEFTPYKLLVSAISSLILVGLWRAVIWVFRISPRKEWAYWLIGSLFIFTVISVLGQIVNPARPVSVPDLNLEAMPLIGDLAPPNEPRVAYVSLIASIRVISQNLSPT